jgi:AcrR family transcriptional regulator
MQNTPLKSAHIRRKRELTIARILETARAIMREDGVAALSMQELARRLDMRAPSLYNYFSSKMDLYDSLFQLGFVQYRDFREQAVQGAKTWQEELQFTFESYMDFAIQNPDLYQLCFERPVPGFVPSEASMQLSLGILHDAYERSAALLSEIDTNLNGQQVTDLVIAMMHGLTALHIANEPQLPIGQGRFGSLIDALIPLLDKAWAKR